MNAIPKRHINLSNLKSEVRKELDMDDASGALSQQMKAIIDKEGGFDKFVEKIADKFMQDGSAEKELIGKLEKQLSVSIKNHAKELLKKAIKENKNSQFNYEDDQYDADSESDSDTSSDGEEVQTHEKTEVKTKTTATLPKVKKTKKEKPI